MSWKLQFSKIYVPNKTEDLSTKVFNMIAGINESKSIMKHISFDYKCRLYGKSFLFIQTIE